MLKNYLLLALRNFRKDRGYAIINLLGLGMALAAVLLIVAYIRFELSFDRHFSNAGRTYQLLMETRWADHTQRNMNVPMPLGKTLHTEFPEVEAAATMTQGQTSIRHHNELITVKYVKATPSFFSLFNYPFKAGNAAAALANPNSIVLTETFATKLFPDQNPVGKTVSTVKAGGKENQYIVSAVIRDMPANNHFNMEAVFPEKESTEALDLNAYSAVPQYVLLKEKADVIEFNRKLTAFSKKYHAPETVNIQLLPVTDIRLHSGKIDDQVNNVSDIRFIYIYGIVALLILITASFNYINLTTARSMQRFKEVGMRKVMGAGRLQLIIQFTGESILLFCLTIPFALLLAYITWPVFCSYLQISDQIGYLLNASNFAYLAGIALLTGILAGAWPAFFLSLRPPVSLFKGINSHTRINFSLRKSLIVLQFSISALLIIATLIVQEQLHMLNNRPLGFNKDHLLILPHTGFNNRQTAAFKQTLLQQSNITAVSVSSINIGKRFGASSSMADPADTTRQLNFAFIDADFDFIQTLEATLVQGRNFSAAYPSDMINITTIFDAIGKATTREQKGRLYDQIYQLPIIISESLAKALHLKKPIDSSLATDALQGRIIGITKDVQALTLKEVSPLVVIRGVYHASGHVYVRIKPDHIPETIQLIRNEWKKFFPNDLFEVEFCDDRMQNIYATESRLASLFTAFALLAISISALGLFSLVALLLKQKTKEIGIRKIMGASLADISALFSKDFIRMIMLAILIASPVAWWGMNKWLQEYATRIEISCWVFVLTGAATLLIALITVNVQVVRAARANPVKSLRSE